MNYSIVPFQQIVEKPWGREVILTPPGLDRVGKLLYVNAGMRLSLQWHDAKEETLGLVSGRAVIWLEDYAGAVRHIPMEREFGYTIAVGQTHRLEAVTDCLFFEVSGPEKGQTFRLKDDFGREHETEAMRDRPDRGWDPKKKE